MKNAFVNLDSSEKDVMRFFSDEVTQHDEPHPQLAQRLLPIEVFH